MINPDSENLLDDLFQSLGGMAAQGVVKLSPKNSEEVVLNKVINDHIYGLLTLEELSPSQISLLAALLQVRR